MHLHSDRLDLRVLEQIAASLGVRLYNVREEGRDRHGRAKLAFVLRPESRDHFRAIRDGRRIWAVCWHGHYAFMEAVFDADPDARLRTKLEDYQGREDFIANAGSTGTRNIGSQMEPVAFAQACACVKPQPAPDAEARASANITAAFLERVRGDFDANAANAAS